MNVLGNVNRGYRPDSNDCVLSDGRVVGPFESRYARDRFEWWFAAKADRLFTAGELFEGRVAGDEYHLVRTDEMSLETHPFATVYDIWSDDDNGLPVFETPRGFAVAEPNRLVFVDSPQRHPADRRLPDRVPAKQWIDLDGRMPAEFTVPSAKHGEVVVFRNGDIGTPQYSVCWRKDGRQTKGLAGISLHSHLATAEKAARARACDFQPPFGKRKNRPRDVQRERLYLWEHSFPAENGNIEDIEAAQALADRITDGLGIKPAVIEAGRKNLVRKSYYKAGHVTLSRFMMDTHTVVHEVAHHAVRYLPGIDDNGHGPVFAGVLLALMQEHMGADVCEAIEQARERDIVVDLDVVRDVGERIAARRRDRSIPPASSPTF